PSVSTCWSRFTYSTMAPSCRVIVSSSASLSCKRPRWATQRTSSAVRAMDTSHLQARHLEQLALLRPLHPAAADALDADAHALDGPFLDDLDVLQVRAEDAPADAGHLPADAAEVLRLAAPGVLVAQRRLL